MPLRPSPDSGQVFRVGSRCSVRLGSLDVRKPKSWRWFGAEAGVVRPDSNRLPWLVAFANGTPLWVASAPRPQTWQSRGLWPRKRHSLRCIWRSPSIMRRSGSRHCSLKVLGPGLRIEARGPIPFCLELKPVLLHDAW